MYSDLVIILTKTQTQVMQDPDKYFYYYHAYYKATWQRINQSDKRIFFINYCVTAQLNDCDKEGENTSWRLSKRIYSSKNSNSNSNLVDQINTTKDNQQKPSNAREQTLSSGLLVRGERTRWQDVEISLGHSAHPADDFSTQRLQDKTHNWGA